MKQLDRKTSTRATLSTDWQEMQKRTDWMAAPGMADYVNGMVSAKPLAEGGHWAIYAREQHVSRLLADRQISTSSINGGLSMMSLACGSGHIEYSLLNQFEWPISYFLGLEYDDQLRSHAEQSFKNLSQCQSEFRFFDFNAQNKPVQQFDIVFCCHSIHHATDLEGLFPFINASLKPEGLFIGIDYFGPTRFQIEYDVLPIIEELFAILPGNLRRNLHDPAQPIEDRFSPPTIQEVRAFDPSESIRSSDLRTLLFSNFKVVDIKPMGGTLLRWLLQNRAGNFDPEIEEHVAIARLLQFIERELIALRKIKSDDLFFVLKKSERFDQPVSPQTSVETSGSRFAARSRMRWLHHLRNLGKRILKR